MIQGLCGPILGVSFSDCLDFSEHFRVVCAKAARSIYALKVLRAHGLQGVNLWQVCRATTMSYLTYAAPVWWGYADVSSRLHLQAVVNRLRRFGILPLNSPHTTKYVSTCVGSYSGRCSTTGSMSYTNFFPRWKRLHIGYDLVPITGSSQGLTIDAAATLLFACSTIRLPHDFLFSLTSSILSMFCFSLILSRTVLWTVLMLCACVCQTNKEFTYLLSWFSVE